MTKKQIYTAAFIIIALIQLAVPAKMIWESEDALLQGDRHLLKLAPFDPNDPFRGKYINLRFEIAQYSSDSPCLVEGKSNQYVSLTHDEGRFSRISQINHGKPSTGEYFSTSLYCYSIDNDKSQYDLLLPFQKYYMEESLAEGAERLARNNSRDTTTDVYAEVYIYQGNARIKQVFIGDQKIEDLVSESLNK